MEPLFLSYTYYYIGSTHLLSFLSLFLKNKKFNELKRFFQKNAIFLKSHQFVTVPKSYKLSILLLLNNAKKFEKLIK